MTKYVMIGMFGVIALIVIAGAGTMAIHNAKVTAVSEERRERMADAIELIRKSDKNLGVHRKANDADLCRALGGKTVDGVCQ